MTTLSCSVLAEDLIAYADGYLAGGRRELVEAHLATCPNCRERKAAFDEVDRLLREGTPPTDDPNGRAMIRARLEREAGRKPAPRGLLAAPVFLVLLALVVTFGPVTEAGFPLGRFVTFGEIERSGSREQSTLVEHVAPSDPDVSTLPFQTVEPAELPLGLVLAERSTPGPERLELLYRDDEDLVILVIQASAKPDMVTIDGPGMETHLVGGTLVLASAGTRPDTVADFLWERHGLFFTVLVLEAPIGPRGGLETSDAVEIVDALVAAQDAAQS